MQKNSQSKTWIPWLLIALFLLAVICVLLFVVLLPKFTNQGMEEAAVPPATDTTPAAASPTPTEIISTETALPEPAPTETPAVFEEDGLLTFFPMQVGMQWTYAYTQLNLPSGTDPAVKQFTRRVTEVDTSLSGQVRVIHLVTSGENFLDPCNVFSDQLISSEVDTWGVLDASSYFATCSQEEAYTLAQERTQNPQEYTLSNNTLPIYRSPIETGSLWPAFADLPAREDTAYQWFVESQDDVIFTAGKFEGCYNITLRTTGDITQRTVCPGFGLVSEEYHHFGSVYDYRFELRDYEIP